MIERRNPSMYSEVVTYWRGIKGTLAQRGLLKQKRSDGSRVVPCARALVLPDKAIFVLDMNRLAGISREQWLDEKLWLQIRATLQGRRTFVVDSAGLALVVAREPGAHQPQRIPRVIPLTRDELPDGAYTVTLGRDRRGSVVLDLAGAHRDILIGGSSGSGKTNLLQALILQLAAKHTPSELQVAIVDTKEVDFTGAWHGLPHLFQPVAHDLDEAAMLIERVEAERIQRKAAMNAASVSDWRDLDDPPPLLLLVVDEAADFAGTGVMETLTMVGRKGRAFGVSIVVGTQYPTSRVISPQLKANLTRRIAFRTSTRTESQVILDRNGAEALGRPGLALTYIGQRWREVQVLRTGDDALAELVTEAESPEEPALTEVETALVRYAVEELDGAFTVGKLYDAMSERISHRQVNNLAKSWQRRGWLTPPQRDANGHPIGRQVTQELEKLAGITLAPEGPTAPPDGDNTEIEITGRYTGPNADNKGDNKASTGPACSTERESPDTAPLPPHYCPVTACRWNNDGRGVCDYARRGLRCGDAQWRDEWREAMGEG